MCPEAWDNNTQDEVLATTFTVSVNASYSISLQLRVLPILSLLIACVGLVSNALNLLVLHAYHTSQITCGGERTARVNLLGLALADFSVCLTSLPLGFVQRTHRSYSFMLFYTIVGPALATYFLTVSVWMVLLVSFARYLAVCRPLNSRTLLTSRHMLRVILCIYVTALLFHAPSFLMYTFEESYSEHNLGTVSCNSSLRKENNTISCFTAPTILVYERPFWSNQTVQICYHVLQIIVTNIGPFVGVVISNIAVIRACRRSDACRQAIVTQLQATRNPACYSGMDTFSSRRLRSAGYKHLYMTANYPTQGLFFMNSNPQYRLSLQHFPNRATNRVTPLLLAVIFAFLLFTAPFGIVHFVCLQVMREMGVRVRDDPQTRRLYMALNLTVEWTNVVQILGCASNFFLYFLVSTTFRRTTKRTFQRLFKQIRDCRRSLRHNFTWGKSTSSSWDNDQRTKELRRALDQKLFSISEKQADIASLHSLRSPIENRYQLHKGNWSSPDPQSLSLFEQSRAQSSPLPDLRANDARGKLGPQFKSTACLRCEYKPCPCMSAYTLRVPNGNVVQSQIALKNSVCRICDSLRDNITNNCVAALPQVECLLAHSEPRFPLGPSRTTVETKKSAQNCPSHVKLMVTDGKCSVISELPCSQIQN